ncbi:Golgi localized Alpha/Beta hydrolase fold, DUF726 family protein [Schizosaccharomyces osmophilus]|uniref:Golgi localized Alpha/Beta hydrolase fold, DUF726 family protein n=1 Tax=Schizosaccharomyces osmophilus TaxID=2545709 RepID=A0AAE9WAE1_9SCHI|nr:Golgi localized Alpha/Beta hydrolase fold, DUF726 family protein [Schizosaccharomyces osmophilus]WBW72697.1 Golgi localized Alpha/Beta hydrolase fold, DUF726 family protein [Schizosaccharomyces osmophilus]
MANFLSRQNSFLDATHSISNQSQTSEVANEDEASTFEERKDELFHMDTDLNESFSTMNDSWQPMQVITSSTPVLEDEDPLSSFSCQPGEITNQELLTDAQYTRVYRDENEDQKHQLDSNAMKVLSINDNDQDELNMENQMGVTEGILTESEKMAYAGVCRLAIMLMVDNVAQLTSFSWYRGECKSALENIIVWADKVTENLYEHLDISKEERKMIENLQRHSVSLGDLAKILVSSNHVTSTSDILEDEDLVDEAVASDLKTSKEVRIDVRWTVICDLFLVLISKSIYDARSRVLLYFVGKLLGLDSLEITKFEKYIIETIETDHVNELDMGSSSNSEAVVKFRKKFSKRRKYVLMGLAGVGGGLVIGLSSGLLAPFISAGIGAAFTTVGLGGVASSGFLAGGGSAAIITVGGVLSGTHLGTAGMARRKADVKTFEFRPLHANGRSNVVVTVSGWMSGKEDDVRLSFSSLDPIVGDVFSVLWEPEVLASAGQTMNILATEVMTQSLQQVLGSTVLVSLMGAIQVPLILTKLSYLIDNPWNNSLDRAKSTGQLLADLLCYRYLGVRPVTLVGYSLGARVIYYCLRELEKKKEYSVVENVYIFGTPVIFKRSSWLKASSVVAGRFVNGFKKNDWILGYLFRATSGGIGRVAGLRSIDDIPGMENIDVTDLVPGHLAYREVMPELLSLIGFELLNEEPDLVQEPIPESLQERQSELLHEVEAEECQKKQQELIAHTMKAKGRKYTPESTSIYRSLKKSKKKCGSSSKP